MPEPQKVHEARTCQQGMRRALVLRAARGRLAPTAAYGVHTSGTQNSTAGKSKATSNFFPSQILHPPPHPSGRAFLVPQIASPPPFQIHAGWLVSRCRHHGSCWAGLGTHQADVHTCKLLPLVSAFCLPLAFVFCILLVAHLISSFFPFGAESPSFLSSSLQLLLPELDTRLYTNEYNLEVPVENPLHQALLPCLKLATEHKYSIGYLYIYIEVAFLFCLLLCFPPFIHLHQRHQHYLPLLPRQ